MENQFFVDSEGLSDAALAKKYRLETDPSSRTDPMEYLPGMEQIQSDICGKVLAAMKNMTLPVIRRRMYRLHWSTKPARWRILRRAFPCGGAVFGTDGTAGTAGDGEALRQYGLSIYPAVYCQLL